MEDLLFTGAMEWHAFPPEGSAAVAPAPPASIEGTLIRMMPEYGVEIPLWDEGGPLEDRTLLVDQLGISESLVTELARWQAEWDDVHSEAVAHDDEPVRPLPPGWRVEHAEHGRALFARLQEEVAPGFEVRLHL